MELGECSAVADEQGRAMLVATAGFQVLCSKRMGGHLQQQSLTVVAAGHQAVAVPVELALYVFADAEALDAHGEAVERQIWVTADRGRVPKGAEPVRGVLYALGTDGCELAEELAGGQEPQAVHLPLERMARGAHCPLETIRIEPANDLDYSWHPVRPMPMEQRIHSDGGCEYGRLLHAQPLAVGRLRPTVRVQCPSGRTLKVDIQDFPTVQAATEYVALMTGGAESSTHLQQNGRVLARQLPLGRCHGGPMLTAVSLPERMDVPQS